MKHSVAEVTHEESVRAQSDIASRVLHDYGGHVDGDCRVMATPWKKQDENAKMLKPTLNRDNRPSETM